MTSQRVVQCEIELCVEPYPVGLVSDTHGLLRPEVLDALKGCQHIVHAGDIGSPEILDALREFAPVLAVRGNNDHGPWAEALPEVIIARFGEIRLCVLHDVAEFDPTGEGGPVSVVVAGHSHSPGCEERSGILFVNPGSAGPRRFRLPVCVARLVLEGASLPRFTLCPLPI